MSDELTPEERSAMRARIVGGAREIKPVGAHRGAWVAGSIAAVLVVAIAGGVAATTTLSAPQIATTPSPTPTATVEPEPEPTSTATPTPMPSPTASGASLGSVPFGGSCANMLDAQVLDDVSGHPMALRGWDWNDGTDTVRGGLTCVWVSTDEYLATVVRTAVFPVDQSPSETAVFGEAGCEDAEPFICTRVGVADGMRVWVRMTGSAGLLSSESQTLLDLALSQVGEYPPGVAATPTASWWAPLECTTVESVLDPEEFGFDTLVVEKPPTATPSGLCTLAFQRGYDGRAAAVYIVPGGAVELPSVIAAGGASVEVAGARSAYWIGAHDGIDGGGSMFLVISDGVNLLHVAVSPGVADPDDDLALATLVAERIIPTLQPVG